MAAGKVRGAVVPLLPHWAADLQRLYDTWLANIDEVRQSVGDDSAQGLIDEATQVGPTLHNRTGVLYTTRRP